MKQSKFSLADVLTVLTALAFGFICFLGKNFSTLGNTTVSITWAAIITVSLAGTAFIAKLLKRTGRNFKTNFTLEIVVLLLFTGLMVFFSYSPFPHYFNVSAKKKEIQNKLQTSITQAGNMFTKYEKYVENREKLYRSTLNTAVLGFTNPDSLKKYDFRPEPPAYSKQIDHKMDNLHADLLPPHYSDSIGRNGIKEVATIWLAKAQDIANSRKPIGIGIVNVVNNVESNSNDWLNQLVGFSQVLERGEEKYATSFPSSQIFTDVKKYFTTPGKPTPLSIGLAAGAYLLMLLSWRVTKRHSRSTGILTTAPYEVVL